MIFQISITFFWVRPDAARSKNRFSRGKIDSIERLYSQKMCAGMCHHLLAPIYSVNISKIPIRQPGPIWEPPKAKKVPKIDFGGFGDL